MTAAEVAAKAGETPSHTRTKAGSERHVAALFCALSTNETFVVSFFPAVSEKSFLESQTSLKIVQTGVGEVLHAHT